MRAKFTVLVVILLLVIPSFTYIVPIVKASEDEHRISAPSDVLEGTTFLVRVYSSKGNNSTIYPKARYFGE